MKKKPKKKASQTTESENVALAVELTPLTRKPSIELVPDGFETATQHNKLEAERDSAADRCDICRKTTDCIGRMFVRCAVYSRNAARVQI